MSKHTPGPWRAEMNGFCRMAVMDKNYTYLTYKAGTDRMPESELEANANLIAAAPDLLEALEAMVEYVDRMHAIGHIQRPVQSSEACAAIAKAKGESS